MNNLMKSFLPLILTSAIAGLILAILAPLGTHYFSFLKRIIFWVGLCIAGGFGAGIVNGIATRLGWILKEEVISFGQSIGATISVSLVYFLIFPPNTLQSGLVTILYIWVISCVISGVGYLLNRQNTYKNSTPQKNDRATLFDRLPPKLRQADIYAISAEDHYVRVHTSQGDEMILMRLSDAIKETSPLIGVIPHRSWWVAEQGVEKVERKDGKIKLLLRNSVTVPVSRNGSKTVKQAGWI